MRDIDYGVVRVNLKAIMKEQGVSINKLACRAEMQRTQLKTYLNGTIQRVDLAVLARLCYVLDCDISDILEYRKDWETGDGLFCVLGWWNDTEVKRSSITFWLLYLYLKNKNSGFMRVSRLDFRYTLSVSKMYLYLK